MCCAKERRKIALTLFISQIYFHKFDRKVSTICPLCYKGLRFIFQHRQQNITSHLWTRELSHCGGSRGKSLSQCSKCGPSRQKQDKKSCNKHICTFSRRVKYGQSKKANQDEWLSSYIHKTLCPQTTVRPPPTATLLSEKLFTCTKENAKQNRLQMVNSSI